MTGEKRRTRPYRWVSGVDTRQFRQSLLTIRSFYVAGVVNCVAGSCQGTFGSPVPREHLEDIVLACTVHGNGVASTYRCHGHRARHSAYAVFFINFHSNCILRQG